MSGIGTSLVSTSVWVLMVPVCGVPSEMEGCLFNHMGLRKNEAPATKAFLRCALHTKPGPTLVWQVSSRKTKQSPQSSVCKLPVLTAWSFVLWPDFLLFLPARPSHEFSVSTPSWAFPYLLRRQTLRVMKERCWRLWLIKMLTDSQFSTTYCINPTV